MARNQILPTHEVVADEYSGHGLLIGTLVYPLPKDEYPTWTDADQVTWYTMGLHGDERAIDPRDLAPIEVD